MISWVQGTTFQASEGGPGTPITVTLNGVTNGNCLIVSVGQRKNLVTAHGLMYLTDNKGNIWLPAITSPSQVLVGTGADFQLFTFIAVNVASGNTTITFHETEHFGAYAIGIDEYSGVGAAFPIDQVTFASTPEASGLTTLNSGSISANSGELVYSAAYGMANPLTLTPSAGFTQRQSVSGNSAYPISLVTWDKQSSGGTYSNVVTANVDPDTMAVNLVGLSPTTIVRPLVQVGAQCISSISVTSCSANFPYPNTLGNLLIAVGVLVERTDATIVDTLGNNWVVVYNDASGTNDTVMMAYCLGCKAGTNIVTMNCVGGGDDDHLMLLVGEYTPEHLFTNSSKNGSLNFAESVNTGSIVVGASSSLFSMYSGGAINNLGLSAPGPVSQLGTIRWQFSDSGFFQEGIHELALADQTVNTAGSYDNIFSISPNSAKLAAGILGFSGIPVNCFLVTFPLLGPYYDLDGNVLANGILSLRLVFDCNCPCADYQITGNNHTIIRLDSNGMVVGAPQVRPNNQLAPSGSYYILQAYSSSGQLALGPKTLVI